MRRLRYSHWFGLVLLKRHAFGLDGRVLKRSSQPLTRTRIHSKPSQTPSGRFLQKAKGTPLNFSWIRCSWIPSAKHNRSNISHTLSRSLSLAFSLIIFNVEQSAASQTKLQISPSRLELEPFCWHVGRRIEAVRSSLDRFWDQVGVLVNLNKQSDNGWEWESRAAFDFNYLSNYSCADHQKKKKAAETYIIRWEELINYFISQFVDILILVVLKLLNFLQSWGNKMIKIHPQKHLSQ